MRQRVEMVDLEQIYQYIHLYDMNSSLVFSFPILPNFLRYIIIPGVLFFLLGHSYRLHFLRTWAEQSWSSKRFLEHGWNWAYAEALKQLELVFLGTAPAA